MPKGYLKRNNAWVELKKLYVKRNGTWTNLATAYLKKNGSWVKVFAAAGPSLNSSPTITAAKGGKLYDTYTSTLGSWDNATTFSRQWGRADTSSGPFTDISGQTSTSYVTRDADDGKYITVTVRATDAQGLFAEASAVPVLIVKYKPVSLAAYTIDGSPTVGSTLTTTLAIGAWKSTTDNSGDTYPDDFDYEWQWADTGSPAYNDNNSDTYSVTAEDLGHTIAVRVTGTNTGGSTTSAYSTATAAVTEPYRFSFGKHLYVGSNGYIGLDAGGSTAGTMGAGRNISIFSKDLQQYYLAEYSDTSTYSLYFRSYIYDTIGSPAARNALDYQIRFYNSSSINYCDIKIIRMGADVVSAVRSPGYYANGSSGYAGVVGPYVWAANSTMRVYFDSSTSPNGPAAVTGVAWTNISDNIWKLIRNDLPGGLDDSFTDVTTAANQQAAVLTAPTITSVSVSNVGGPVSVNFTGGSGPFYQAFWNTPPTAPIGQVQPDASGSSSPLTDNTGPSSGDTNYMYVRSVLTVGELSVGPSTLASSWSAGFPFNMIQPVPVNTSQPTLSGSLTVGSVVTATVGSWSNSPTSYDLRIYRGTQFVATSETLVRSAGNVTSTTYTITQADYDSGQRYLRTFASASNSGGSSVLIGGQEIGPIIPAATVPTAPTSVFANNITSSGARINWSAPSSDGGATITRYEVNRDGGGFFSVGNVFFYDYFISVAGNYTIGVRAVNSVGAGPAATVSVTIPAAFVTPSAPAPSLNFRRFPNNGSANWEYFCDYPNVSGSVQSITGMQYEIYSANSTAGSTITGGSGTLGYPGAFTYPYTSSRDGTIWAFRIASGSGGRVATTAGRFGRVRVVMLGTNGTTYFGTWSSPLL
jgi:hypothetical protein